MALQTYSSGRPTRRAGAHFPVVEPASFVSRQPGAAAVTVVSDDFQPGEAMRLLEAGGVLLIPRRRFDLGGAEDLLFAGIGPDRAKSISYNPRDGVLKGVEAPDADLARLGGTLARFGDWAERLVVELAPAYARALERGKASFRPRAADAPVSARRDDRRLHVDSFPSQPVQGRRILRVFRNVHPAGEDRVWRIGEPFRDYAARFLPRARAQAPGAAMALQALGLTKGRRTAYDDLMLQLHDAAKADEGYQAEAPGRLASFAPGATWIVYTDSVVHAALKGRHAFEQTFFLPVHAMADQSQSPLRILEAMTGRRLA